MSFIPVRLATVTANGKRFIVISEEKNKVRCRGEVLRVSGASAVHGPDKVFLANRVTVTGVDYDESLLLSLAAEVDSPPHSAIEVIFCRCKVCKHTFVSKEEYDEHKMYCKPKVKRKRYISDGMITKYGNERLVAEGYDCAMDQLGNGWDESMLSDAAMDCAAYHHELTIDGAREGVYTGIRESAADSIYEGMLKALAEKRAAGKDVGDPK